MEGNGAGLGRGGEGLEVRIAGLGGDGLGHGGGESTQIGGADAEAVIRHAACQREMVLRDVETVHRSLGIAALGKAVGEAETALGAD